MDEGEIGDMYDEIDDFAVVEKYMHLVGKARDEIDDTVEDISDPRFQARKVLLEKRRNELHKLGFRRFDNPRSEREFILRSSQESDRERLERERVKRMLLYKKNVDKPVVFVLEDYNDRSFDKVLGKPLPLARDEHIKIFDKITTKNNGEYRKQHWHMNEVEMVREMEESEEESAEEEESVEEESAEEESAEEDSTEEQRRKPLRVDTLTFRFHPELWKIDLHGEFTNTLPNTLQICSLKLTSPDDSDYPLKVYGDLTLCYKHKPLQQVIFSRDSDNCQTLTKEDPYLSLTGPYWNPMAPPNTEVYIKADLKLKGTTKSDADKFLCLSTKCQEKDLVCDDEFSEYDLDFDPDDPYMCHVSSCCEKKPCECREFGKHYLLEMTRTIVAYSVFASICVQLVGMEPPDQLLSCFFTAYSDESCEDMKVVLLDCRDGKEEPVLEKDKEKEDVYTFELSRQTICVDWRRRLTVYIEHGKTGKELIFKPQLEGEDTQDVDIGSSGSRIQVKVEWSVYWEKNQRLLY